jgi:hypothetical protein
MYEVTFHGVSAATFENVQAHLLQARGATARDDGGIDCQGVSCCFRHDPQAATLEVAVLVQPSLVTKGFVVGWIFDALKQYAVKPKRSDNQNNKGA